jgi:LysR family transcriptional regulator, flagellar master operon regulator
MMNIDQVRTFLEIAATGNFNRAAEHLNVAQSTASVRIKALEDRLDRPLFTRVRSGVELTAAGHQFHRYAVTLVRAWEQARQEVALPEGFTTMFGLGAQVSLWERLVVRWIPWMREKAPDVSLNLVAEYSEPQMRGLSDGLIDIGVMYAPRNAPGLIIEKLLEEKLILVSTAKRRLSAKWMEGFVFVDWGDDFRAAYSAAFPEWGPPAITVGLGAIGLQYIMENGGSGYFPLRVVRPLLAAKRLHRVPKAPVFRRPAFMVYPSIPTHEELLGVALDGLRHVASLESDD